MNIIAMIPARYDATRFPAKLMQSLAGKSVILRTYEATKNTNLFKDVYVVTDSNIIFNEIVTNGGKAIMSKKEHQSGSDRIAEAVKDIDVDIVVNVQGDEPFTKKESLQKLLKVFDSDSKKEIDLASLMVEIKNEKEINSPNTVKVVVDHSNFALYFSRSVIPFSRDKETETKYYKHQGVYAFKKEALLDFYNLPMQYIEAAEKIECIRYLEYGKKIKMVETFFESVEIDTPEDLKRAQKLFKKGLNKK